MDTRTGARRQRDEAVLDRSQDRLDRVYRLYRKHLARCRTENQLNRLHIVLGNYMTPMEVRYFKAALADDPSNQAARRWMANLDHFMPIKKARPFEFERRATHRAFTQYTADTASAQQKTLIIAFAGNFHRLMLPTPAFLDCLDPALYDVIMLRDFRRSLFIKGIPGLGGDFFEAMSNLEEHFAPHSYRTIIALGTSGGGVPALLAAILLKASRGISVGGTDFARFSARVKSCGMSDEAYAALLASRPEPFPDLFLVYSAGYAHDADAARAMHERVPSQLWEVHDCEGHLLLAQKLEQGKLPAFMAKLLGQSLGSDEPVHVAPRVTA
jgi:hypothetical protein